MNFSLSRFRAALAVALFCAGSLWAWAYVPVQQGTAGATAAQADVHGAPMCPSDFDVKIVQGDFSVRRKGTAEWIPSSKVSEPIVVGCVDSDHKIYVVTKALKPPKALHMESADYPSSESKSGKKGRVSLHVVVDDHGAVRFPTVDSTLGPEFTRAAIEAVKKWRFEPARLNGQPVAVIVNVTMSFIRLY